MKFAKRITVAVLFSILLLIFIAPSVLAVASLWEYYNTNDDASVVLWGPNWSAQTFTTDTESHSVAQIRLKSLRTGTSGTVTVSIRATTAGVPTGFDLTSGTIDGTTISTAAGGSWYPVTVTTFSLLPSTVYAVIVRAVSGADAGNSISWRADASAPTLTGSEYTSTDGGVSWSADATTDYMFELWGDRLITVVKAEIYRSYIEENDILVVAECTNTYVPYYSDYDPSKYFDVQLRDTAGTTVLASTVCQAWGDKPISIYINATQAVALTNGALYRVYLRGAFAPNPAAYYTLTASDWRGSNLSALDDWVFLTAHHMETYYGVILTDYIGTVGEVLNEEGGAIFNVGIPALSSVRPDLFKVATHSPEVPSTSFTNIWSGTSWESRLGTEAEDVLDRGSVIMGMGANGGQFGGIIVFGIYAFVAMAIIAGGRGTRASFGAAAAIGLPFLIGGAYLNLVDIVFIMVISAVIVFMATLTLFWSRM